MKRAFFKLADWCVNNSFWERKNAFPPGFFTLADLRLFKTLRLGFSPLLRPVIVALILSALLRRLITPLLPGVNLFSTRLLSILIDHVAQFNSESTKFLYTFSIFYSRFVFHVDGKNFICILAVRHGGSKGKFLKFYCNVQMGINWKICLKNYIYINN